MAEKLAEKPKAIGNKSLVAEIEQAKADWQQAWENFHNANKDFVDAAIWGLRAAMERYDALLRLAKEDEELDRLQKYQVYQTGIEEGHSR